MFTLFSDGGADRGGHAAAAAIIHVPGDAIVRVVAYLGEATNNEAEIAALLVGLAAIRVLSEDDAPGIDWFADSEYTLLSATQYIRNWERNGWKTSQKEPVKNQGLWRLYLQISKGLKLKPNHVRGHTGHPENEACDAACNWLKGYVAQSEEFPAEPMQLPTDGEHWFVVDGREFLETARDFLEGGEEAIASAACQLSSSVSNVRAGGESADPQALHLRFCSRAIAELTACRDRIAAVSAESPIRSELLKELDRLVTATKKKC